MFSLRVGLSFEMSKFFRIRSSGFEEEQQEDKTEKLADDTVWFVRCECAWILERDVVANFLPVKGETSMCSEIRVCIWYHVWSKYSALQHWHVICKQYAIPVTWELVLERKETRKSSSRLILKRSDICGKAEEHNIFILSVEREVQ